MLSLCPPVTHSNTSTNAAVLRSKMIELTMIFELGNSEMIQAYSTTRALSPQRLPTIRASDSNGSLGKTRLSNAECEDAVVAGNAPQAT
ncbi:hypothetical protein ACFX1R_006761 [Malus domestica]